MILSGMMCLWRPALKHVPSTCCRHAPVAKARRSFTLSSLLLESKTLYATLGVSRNASKRDIRTAFLTLSKIHHPDMSTCKDSHSTFMEISQAYNTLSNPVTRYQYDMQLYSAKGREANPPPPVSHYYNVSEEASSGVYQQPVPRPSHTRVIVGLVVMMIVGVVIHSYRIRLAHNQFQQKSYEESRRNLQLYNSVRESAAASSVSEQLERLN